MNKWEKLFQENVSKKESGVIKEGRDEINKKQASLYSII